MTAIAILILLAVVPCDPVAEMEALTPCPLTFCGEPTGYAPGDMCHYTPTPVIRWCEMDEHVDGFRIYYWNADEPRGETWRYLPCWWYPDEEWNYGDRAGTRFCHGEKLPRPVQREIDFPAGTLINVCVTAVVDEGCPVGIPHPHFVESENCSDVVSFCAPEVWEYPQPAP